MSHGYTCLDYSAVEIEFKAKISYPVNNNMAQLQKTRRSHPRNQCLSDQESVKSSILGKKMRNLGCEFSGSRRSLSAFPFLGNFSDLTTKRLGSRIALQRGQDFCVVRSVGLKADIREGSADI